MLQADNGRTALIDSLNALLADHFSLYLKTKNFHWHVRGHQFRDLHLLFDAQATEILALTDIIAERVRKNRGDTLTSIGAIAARSRVADQDDANLDPRSMIAELAQDNRKLIEAIRGVKTIANAAGDNATEGAADDWTDQTEQRVWFLTSLLG